MVCPAHGKPSLGDHHVRLQVGDMVIVQQPDGSPSYKRFSGESLWSSPSLDEVSTGIGLARPGTLAIVLEICTCPHTAWTAAAHIACSNGLVGWADHDGLQRVDDGLESEQ